jgi:hypothetical protein
MVGFVELRNRTTLTGPRKRCGAPLRGMQQRSIPLSGHPWMSLPGSSLASWQHTRIRARPSGQEKKVEALFGELNNQIDLLRVRLRRLKFIREQFFLGGCAEPRTFSKPTGDAARDC